MSEYLQTVDARDNDCSRVAVLKRIEKCEREGRFDFHVDPVNYSLALPVDGSFNYIRKPITKIKNFFLNQFAVKPFISYYTRRVMKERIYGRENLKGIKSAIVTCNHVNMFDCLVAKRALKGHRLMITAADFNNRSDALGSFMRAGGLMPFGDVSAMRNFNKAMNYYLKHDTYVLFYPEQALWWNYRKPRPFKDGAFFYATKHDVPVIPMFITFRPSGKLDRDGIEIQYFDEHILPPVYPDKSLCFRDNIDMMRDRAFQACKDLYEATYGKKLCYTCDEVNL